jgi:hypothetical protein
MPEKCEGMVKCSLLDGKRNKRKIRGLKEVENLPMLKRPLAFFTGNI